jgi:outer membrane lipoprotein-sorting protein
MILRDGTITANEANMKNTLLFAAALALLAVTGCSQSSTDQSSASDTNSAAQNAEQTASNAWQDTKGAATNAYNDAKEGATNAWNKTTNAINGGNP